MEFHFGLVNTIATALTFLLTLFNIIVFKLRQIQETNSANISSSHPDLGQKSLASGSEQLCRSFTLGDILVATKNFDENLVIGRGGFGKVYKGFIDDGRVTVAIKRSSKTSKQGAPQFWTEVKLLSKFRHSHLVSLIGYCYNPDEMILVYDYMPHGSLADHIYKNGSNSTTLSWIQRVKICIGAGQGLDYLHTGTGINDRVIHRDMKSSNILLDENWAAKVSDFGLSKIGPANQDLTHVSTNVQGTHGYFDPEYMVTHRLTRKSDVYSFGVVLLEVLSGKRAMDPTVCEEHWDLTGWAKECINKKDLYQIIDPVLKHEILSNSLKEFVQIAEKCLQYRSRKRPTMAQVVTSLERVLALQDGTDSSMLEKDFMNLGWTNSNTQENLDEFDDVTGNGGVIKGEVIRNVRLPGNSQSIVRSSKIASFKRMARRFKLPRSSTDPTIESFLESQNNFMLIIRYSYSQIKEMTNGFKDILSKGTFGSVFKAKLPSGRIVAIKLVSYRATEYFTNAVTINSRIHHINIVKLIGFCAEGSKLALVHDYMPNGSLSEYIFSKTNKNTTLSCKKMYNIALGVARGMEYLHKGCDTQILHLDIQAFHVLLDQNFNPKISGFGLAKSYSVDDSTVALTATPETDGNLAPELYSSNIGRVSLKADVYSFGMLLLEMVWMSVYVNAFAEHSSQLYFLHWVYDRIRLRQETEFRADISEESKKIVRKITLVALLCIQLKPTDRPSMRKVLEMLQGDAERLNLPSKHSFYSEEVMDNRASSSSSDLKTGSTA